MSPLTRTKIEWVKNPDGTQGFSANPIKGRCPVGCKWCYAWGEDNPQALVKRFKWDKTLRFEPKVLRDIEKRKAPSGIFMCSTMELFHFRIDEDWRSQILWTIRENERHRFYLLTKRPDQMPSPFFVPHCWVGVTVTSSKDEWRYYGLALKPSVYLRFISFEPLLGALSNYEFPKLKEEISWLILGAQTGGKKADRVIPKREWVEPILEQADKYKIPVFIKNNMRGLVNQWGIPFKQEMPTA